VIGCGGMGCEHLEAAADVGKAEVVAVVVLAIEATLYLTATLEEEVVLSPEIAARTALMHGKHVLCEKQRRDPACLLDGNRYSILHAPAVADMSEECAPNSCYCVSEGRLGPLRSDREKPHPIAVLIHDQFRGLLLSTTFPCLGGTGAVRREDYRFAVYSALGSADSVQQCASDLACFVSECPADSNPVAVFVAAFQEPVLLTEVAFEAALWEQLRGLNELDDHPNAADSRSGTASRPSPHVQDDDPGFVFCGREFFVVGLHPASSRWARRFGWPTLVFNALTHSDELRRLGKYERMKQKILGRDRRLQGTDNPSLPFSQMSQFSGRQVDSRWQCPTKFK